METHELLQEAANDAKEAYEFNKDREPNMRMSRAGLPLMQLVLEDIVIPKLPKRETRTKITSDVSKKMALGNGHLFEKVVGEELRKTFADTAYQVKKQVPLNYNGITGTADFVVSNDERKLHLVVECKSLNIRTLKEAKETKLYTDNWGYFSQLLLYCAALSQAYPDYTVHGQWEVWAKQSNRKFTTSFDDANADEFLAHINARHKHYQSFKQAFDKQETSTCISILSSFDDPLPVCNFYYGNLANSCGLHYSPWSKIVIDEDGLMLDNWQQRLKIALAFCFGDSELESEVKTFALYS